MSCRLLLLLAALCLLSPTLEAAAVRSPSDTSAFPMRWRVFADYQSGISFRYPYEYFIPDQYAAGLIRERRWEYVTEGLGEELEIDGRKVMTSTLTRKEKGGLDVKVFNEPVSGLLGEVDIAAFGKLMAADPKLGLDEEGQAITWASYDYYQNPKARPHADRAWAPSAIEGHIGEGEKACGLILKTGGRYTGVILTGKLDEHRNRALIDSFEVLSGKAKEKTTWREAMGRKGMVINGDGVAIKAVKSSPASWERAWDLETRHYHVTSQVSPARLLEYGTYLEALYGAYAGVYEPDQVPPYKMEVHVFNSQSDFQRGAAEHGIPVGPSVGGFFVPSLLSIFAFQVMPEYFSTDFTVEKVLAHECSHQFLHCTCNGSDHVPTWINEGLAVYFESSQFKAGKFTFQPPHTRVEILQQLYAQKKQTLRPLGDYLKHYGHIAPAEYGEVYAMTHFWVFASKSGKERFKKYWLALKAGENGSEAFERIFMEDMIKAKGSRDQAIAAWQVALIEYVNKVLK